MTLKYIYRKEYCVTV